MEKTMSPPEQTRLIKNQAPLLIMATTNDQWQDQRMMRWCQTLEEAGWQVRWIGVHRNREVSLPNTPTRTYQRLGIWPLKGPLFYLHYNLRLLMEALRWKPTVFLSVDADTLPALRLASWLRGRALWWDAHEWFTEVPELSGRPIVRAGWTLLIRLFLRGKVQCYTVGPALAGLFHKAYGYPFRVLRNMPSRNTDSPALPLQNAPQGPYILYQGALNQGRGLEALLEAAEKGLPCPLVLAGSGDLEIALRSTVRSRGLHNKVWFTGPLPPAQLRSLTQNAWIGLNLLDHPSLSYRYSLANKFFDYAAAGLPQLGMDFPEYQALLREYPVGWGLEDCQPERIARICNELWSQPERMEGARQACLKAAERWTWENESRELLEELRVLAQHQPSQGRRFPSSGLSQKSNR